MPLRIVQRIGRGGPGTNPPPAIRIAGATLATVGVIALAGCGSKPGYCADRTKLEDSVKGLTSVNLSSGTSGLESQLKTIQSDANAVISSAKGDFPSQTSAIKSSVDALTSAVQALPSSPSAGQIAMITAQATSVVNSVKSFTDATNSKCS